MTFKRFYTRNTIGKSFKKDQKLHRQMIHKNSNFAMEKPRTGVNKNSRGWNPWKTIATPINPEAGFTPMFTS